MRTHDDDGRLPRGATVSGIARLGKDLQWGVNSWEGEAKMFAINPLGKNSYFAGGKECLRASRACMEIKSMICRIYSPPSLPDLMEK